MEEVDLEMKQLQKLSRTDLVVLLGQLEGHLEKEEQASEQLRLEAMELAAEKAALEKEKHSLTVRNAELAGMLKEANKRLAQQQEAPTNWRAIETFARQLTETERQVKEQIELLTRVREERQEDAALALKAAQREAEMIVETARREAVSITKQLQLTNLQMLSSMQEALGRAHSGYEAAFTGKYTQEQPEWQAAQVTPQEGHAEERRRETENEKKVALSPQQAKRLLRMLKRLNHAESEAAEASNSRA